MGALKEELRRMQSDYKTLQSDNVKLSARNAFLNNRLSSFSDLFQHSKKRNQSTRGGRTSDGGLDADDDPDLGVDGDAAKCMQMISHQRKNSDSTFNKSPSFLSTLGVESQLGKDEFYLSNVENENERDGEEKRVKPSKSRDERVVHSSKKRKPQKKKVHRRRASRAAHSKARASDSSDY